MDAGVIRKQDPVMLLFTLYTAVIGSLTEASVLASFVGTDDARTSLKRREAEVVDLVRAALWRRTPGLGVELDDQALFQRDRERDLVALRVAGERARALVLVPVEVRGRLGGDLERLADRDEVLRLRRQRDRLPRLDLGARDVDPAAVEASRARARRADAPGWSSARTRAAGRRCRDGVSSWRIISSPVTPLLRVAFSK